MEWLRKLWRRLTFRDGTAPCRVCGRVMEKTAMVHDISLGYFCSGKHRDEYWNELGW